MKNTTSTRYGHHFLSHWSPPRPDANQREKASGTRYRCSYTTNLSFAKIDTRKITALNYRIAFICEKRIALANSCSTPATYSLEHFYYHQNQINTCLTMNSTYLASHTLRNVYFKSQQ